MSMDRPIRIDLFLAYPLEKLKARTKKMILQIKKPITQKTKGAKLINLGIFIAKIMDRSLIIICLAEGRK